MDADVGLDAALAAVLQAEEYEKAREGSGGGGGRGRSDDSCAGGTAAGGMSLLDPLCETLDPTPDIFALFAEYDDLFFGGVLKAVEVRWSHRMTLCAGLCCYQSGGYCSIRLSSKLLMYRPRSDTVNTLLHEMIHAYLFVTKANQDHDGHGEDFQQHMNRINAVAGTEITVYHSFHNEVSHWRQHWWRCNGPCRERAPYHGWCKRSMNRPPGPTDHWWSAHQANCGGVFEKVKEPEEYSAKRSMEDSKKRRRASAASEGDREGAKRAKSLSGAPSFLDAWLLHPTPSTPPSTVAAVVDVT